MFTFAKEKILKNNMSRSAICRITLMKLSRRDFSPKFLQRPIWSYKLSKISLKNCHNFLWSKYLNVLLTPSNWLNPTSQCCYYKTTFRALSRGRKSQQGPTKFSKFLIEEKSLKKLPKLKPNLDPKLKWSRIWLEPSLNRWTRKKMILEMKKTNLAIRSHKSATKRSLGNVSSGISFTLFNDSLTLSKRVDSSEK